MEHTQYDHEFYETNIIAHGEGIYRFVCSILKNQEDASDVTQIVMMKSWEKLDELRSPDKAKAWLFQIAHREAMMHLRQNGGGNNVFSLEDAEGKKLTLLADASEESALEHMIREHEGSIAMEAFQLLDGESQQLIRLRYLDSFSSKEIAEILQGKRGSVRSSLSRALRKYRKLYQKLERGGLALGRREKESDENHGDYTDLHSS